MSGRRRKDSLLSELSNRSNGLAFNHHHFILSSNPSPRKGQGLIPSHTNGSSTRQTAPSSRADDYSKEALVTTGQTVRSLIPPVDSIRYKSEPKVLHRRQNTASSIKSFQILDHPIQEPVVTTSTLNLATMPGEILDLIFQNLPQEALRSLMFTNSNFNELATTHLYSAPEFASTYRFAQFTYTITHQPNYAHLVHYLDLSHFSKDVDSDGQLVPMAGWREWKYRHGDIYHAHHHATAAKPRQKLSPYQKTTRSHQVSQSINKRISSHPLPSPMLEAFNRTRDVPIGGVCNVLAACPNLKQVNLSRLQLASDFLVLPPGFPNSNPAPAYTQYNNHTNLTIITDPALWTTSVNSTALPNPTYPNTMLPPSPPPLRKPNLSSNNSLPSSPIQNLTFISTVPRSTDWNNHEIAPLYVDEIMFWLTQLPLLQKLKISYCVWLSSSRVAYLMRHARPKLKIDFRESGMQTKLPWAIEGTLGELREVMN